jgi:acetyl esterase/lipase
MISKQTFTYKVVGDCAIKADVYREADSTIRPVIVFIHGGALIGGTRSDPLIVIEMLANAGYTVVSIDYRLAPETKLKNIIEDLRDAFSWVREEGRALFNINPNRIGVVGNSAGGYLTLMSGFVIVPLPKALVSISGYGDIDGSWYSKPDPFYCQQPLITESTARAAVGIRPISETSPPHNRRLFYLYCRQHGSWPKEVTGYDPEIEPEAFDPFCPVRNVTIQYPPTLLLHGDMDTDVPHEQSVAMAKKLEEAGIEHQLVTVLGRGHGFEVAGFADPVVADALNKALAFLKQYV